MKAALWPRVTICKGKWQWKTIICSEPGHRLCTLVLAGHLRTDSLCWARCVARTLCNRRPRRLWTAAGTSCRGCRPEALADGRVAHGQLGSSAPVDGALSAGGSCQPRPSPALSSGSHCFLLPGPTPPRNGPSGSHSSRVPFFLVPTPPRTL